MFLTKTDLTSIIYLEDINIITEGDDTKVSTAIAAAIDEATGYMDRYQSDVIFAGTAATDPVLAEMCKALACWYLVAACPANQNTKDLEDRVKYVREIWLPKIQNGKIKPKGWPLNVVLEQNTFFHVTSYDKRDNNY